MTHSERATGLATFTFALLVVYVPVETWYSLPELWDPFYLVDLIGMVLLMLGALRSRRHAAPLGRGLLVAGYSWTAANFWRALFGRVMEVSAGGALDYGWAELCFTGCILIAALAGLVWSLMITATRPAG